MKGSLIVDSCGGLWQALWTLSSRRQANNCLCEADVNCTSGFAEWIRANLKGETATGERRPRLLSPSKEYSDNPQCRMPLAVGLTAFAHSTGRANACLTCCNAEFAAADHWQLIKSCTRGGSGSSRKATNPKPNNLFQPRFRGLDMHPGGVGDVVCRLMLPGAHKESFCP